jgi:hypothetical protein
MNKQCEQTDTRATVLETGAGRFTFSADPLALACTAVILQAIGVHGHPTCLSLPCMCERMLRAQSRSAPREHVLPGTLHTEHTCTTRAAAASPQPRDGQSAQNSPENRAVAGANGRACCTEAAVFQYAAQIFQFKDMT